MDNLERFVRENREKLDRYEPSPAVWEKISGSTVFIKRKLLIRLSAAAVLTFIIGTAILLYSSSNNKQKLSGLPAEVREMELFYNSMANSLYLQARPMLTGQPEVEKELKNDMERIDNICKEIKKDLNDNVANQEVIEALIQNYTIKIHILEEMLSMLKENEKVNEKPKSNEL
jgi:hypothetical protein